MHQLRSFLHCTIIQVLACPPRKWNPCRSFGTYDSKLWDDIFSEFQPITEDDIIIVNFAAWYPKYKISEPFIPYMQWEESMAGAPFQRSC